MTSIVPRWPGRGSEEELRLPDCPTRQTYSRPASQTRPPNRDIAAEMGLTISSLFTRLFGKKQMRILMGKMQARLFSSELTEPLYDVVFDP